MRVRRSLLTLALLASGLGCGNAGTSGGGSTSSGVGTGGSTSAGGQSPFTYGLNLGYYNGQLTDTKESQLGLAAGADSHRHKLTESFLDTWGDTIHVPELTAMTQ